MLEYLWTTISVVEDEEIFIDELLSIPNYKPFRPPIQFSEGMNVIHIVYANGDWQLISCFEQIGLRADGTGSFKYYHFDEEQYNSLIEKYINIQPHP